MTRTLLPQSIKRLAIGIGSSKGNVAALDQRLQAQGERRSALPSSPLVTAPGDITTIIARSLHINTYQPCAVAAACSTGLACLLAGADLIERNQADHALVGAAETSLTPWLLAGFSNSGVLCGQTLPQAFAQPTGFAPAEGAAVFTLSRTTAAPYLLRAGVRFGDAGHETHFTDPSTLHTALSALWDILPNPDLIVCHATGTRNGDTYERMGLDTGPWSEIPRLCCKPWIGHSLGASGAIELAVALETGLKRIWKLSLGFGGHLVGVAVERQ